MNGPGASICHAAASAVRHLTSKSYYSVSACRDRPLTNVWLSTHRKPCSPCTGLDAQDRPVHRQNLTRSQFETFCRKLAPTKVVLEACGSSRHWSRFLQGFGHVVRLIPPQYVKPFVKRGKNDRNDTAAIKEEASRSDMRFVPVKTLAMQAEAVD